MEWRETVIDITAIGSSFKSNIGNRNQYVLFSFLKEILLSELPMSREQQVEAFISCSNSKRDLLVRDGTIQPWRKGCDICKLHVLTIDLQQPLLPFFSFNQQISAEIYLILFLIFCISSKNFQYGAKEGMKL